LVGDRSGIGGAVFSAGAGGSAGWAPAFCASASGRAGCGGTSDGAPGPRAEYNDRYYAAFVRDPDGNRIEAVTFV